MSTEQILQYDGVSHRFEESHGSTPAAWTTVMIIFLGFAFIAVAILTSSWAWFAIGAAGLVVGPVIGKIMSVLAGPAPSAEF